MVVKGFDNIDLKGVKGILLDIDNTLYPYEPTHKAALKMALEIAEELTGLFHETLNEAYNRARKKVHHQLPTQAAGHSRLLYFQLMLEELMGRTMYKEVVQIEEAYWKEFLFNMHLADDARLFILDAYEKGIPFCFVTDLTAAIQHRKVSRLGLEKMVQYLVSSEEAGVEKPDEMMFKLAAEKLKLNYSDLIMLGDSEKKDIVGAEALGIKAHKIEFIFD